MKFKFKREHSIGKIKLKLERLTGKSSARIQLPEFKSGLWNLSGGAYLNKNGSLVFENEKSRAESPFIGVDGNLITLSFMSEDDGKMYGIIRLYNEGKNKIRENGFAKGMKTGEKIDVSYSLPEEAKFAKIILLRHSVYGPEFFSIKEAGVRCRFIEKNAGE